MNKVTECFVLFVCLRMSCFVKNLLLAIDLHDCRERRPIVKIAPQNHVFIMDVIIKTLAALFRNGGRSSDV